METKDVQITYLDFGKTIGEDAPDEYFVMVTPLVEKKK